MSDFNTRIMEEFRQNQGRVAGPFEGASLVLLTTTGARSGEPRTNPLVSLEEDGHLYVFASYAGAPTNPAWYHNLVANPVVGVEQGDDRFEATAVPVNGTRRDEIYARQAERMPGFAEYQEKTDRVIPVVELVRT